MQLDQFQPVELSGQVEEIELDEELMEEFMQIPGETDNDKLMTLLNAWKDIENRTGRLKQEVAQLTQGLAQLKGSVKEPSVKYSGMSDGDLKGHHGPGSTPEKLRRVMALIMAYNADKPVDQRYRLSAANLRKVSGCRHNSVVDWTAQRQDEIDNYNETSGLGSVQSDRGKPDIVNIVVW